MKHLKLYEDFDENEFDIEETNPNLEPAYGYGDGTKKLKFKVGDSVYWEDISGEIGDIVGDVTKAYISESGEKLYNISYDGGNVEDIFEEELIKWENVDGLKSEDFNNLSYEDKIKFLEDKFAVSKREAYEICDKDTKVCDLPDEIKYEFN